MMMKKFFRPVAAAAPKTSMSNFDSADCSVQVDSKTPAKTAAVKKADSSIVPAS